MPKPVSTERGAEIDLAAIESEVRLEEAYQRDGHSARTLVREADLRVVLIAMKAGARIAQHRASASVSVHTLRGHARLRVADRTVELPAGRLLVLEAGLEHDVEAVSETSILLTLGHPSRT
jgi:quercetin dioxygenase-like cupin family protein